jgi:Domain of unknown function (DUF4124)
MRIRLIFLLAAGLGLSANALGQTLYRYVDERGVAHYSDKPLIEATGRPTAKITSSGARLPGQPGSGSDAAGSGEPPNGPDRARRAEANSQARYEQRRNLALLATYNSLEEIDQAENFALREPKKSMRDAQARMIEAGRRRADLRTQVEALGTRPVPAELSQDLANAEFEFRSLATLVQSKRREVQAITSRFDEDRRRYELLLARQPAPAEAPHTAVN